MGKEPTFFIVEHLGCVLETNYHWSLKNFLHYGSRNLNVNFQAFLGPNCRCWKAPCLWSVQGGRINKDEANWVAVKE